VFERMSPVTPTIGQLADLHGTFRSAVQGVQGADLRLALSTAMNASGSS
jgi:hypothetical protein